MMIKAILILLMSFSPLLIAGFDAGNGGRTFTCLLEKNSDRLREIHQNIKREAELYQYYRLFASDYDHLKLEQHFNNLINLQKEKYGKSIFFDFWYYQNLYEGQRFEKEMIRCSKSFYWQLEDLYTQRDFYQDCEIGFAIKALRRLAKFLPVEEKQSLESLISKLISELLSLTNEGTLEFFLGDPLQFVPLSPEYQRYEVPFELCSSPLRQAHFLPVGFFQGGLWLIHYGLFFSMPPEDRSGFLIHEVVYQFLVHSYYYQYNFELDFKLEDVLELTNLLSANQIKKAATKLNNLLQ